MDIVELALACYRAPLAHQYRFVLSAPLPEGMDQLLRLANDSPEVLDAAMARTGAKPQELRDAARFCIQQWCFVRGADPHRVLGVAPGTASEQIKEHYRLLIRLFHPDRTASHKAWTDLYASRVNEAWTALSRTQSPSPAAASGASSPPAQRALAGAGFPPESPPRPAAPHLKPPPIKYPHQQRLAVPRHWLPGLVLGGLAITVALGLGGLYLSTLPIQQELRAAPDLSGLADSGRVLAVDAVDRSALAALASAPDWQALDRQEQQARQQAAQVQQEREQLEQKHREQVAVEEGLVKRMRAERARLEAQLKAEQARVERVKAERLVLEQRRLEQVKAELAQAEQARTQRLATEQGRLQQLQVEQTKAERLADELRAKRQRLEQAKAEQAKAEQVKAERTQAERQRLEEQLKQERARAEQAKAEQARLAAQLKAERQRLTMETAANHALPQVETVALAMTESEERQLTAADLEKLIGSYTRAYEQGDLSQVMALFAANARGRNAVSRSQIRQDYAHLLATHFVRRLLLRDLHWVYSGESASGSGRYQLQLRQRTGGALSQLEGDIRFEVRKREGQILIEAIDYDWPGS